MAITSTSSTGPRPATTSTTSTPAAKPAAAEVCTPKNPRGEPLQFRDGFDAAATPPVSLSGALLPGSAERKATPDGGSLTAQGALASATVSQGDTSLTGSVGAIEAEREHEVEDARLSGSAEVSASAAQLQGTTPLGGGTLTTTATVGTVTAAAEGKANPAGVSGGLTASVGTAAAELEVRAADGSTTKASFSGPSLEYGVEASGNLTMSGVDVKVELSVDATLAEASASRTQTLPVEIGGEPYELEVSLEALGKISAEGTLELELHVGPDGTTGKIDVDGFAGAQAALTGGLKLRHEGDLVAEGELELNTWAGTPRLGRVGGDAGYENGLATLSFDASTGGAAGMSVSLDAKLDPAEVSEAVYDTVTGPLRDAFTPVSPEEQQRAMDELLESYGTTYAFGA